VSLSKVAGKLVGVDVGVMLSMTLVDAPLVYTVAVPNTRSLKAAVLLNPSVMFAKLIGLMASTGPNTPSK
jgi:hypothetical protein